VKRKFLTYVPKAALYLTPLIVGLVLIHFQIFWFAQGPIHAIDNETPLNPVFYFWNILYPWNPLSLGSPAPLIALDIVYGVIATISLGNELVSQVIVLSLPPIVGYFGVLVLTKKILKSSLVGSIFASFFFAFSTPYLVWFSIPYMIGLALIPWLFYIGFRLVSKIFDNNISPKAVLFYSSAFSFLFILIASVYIHVLPLYLLLFGISCVFLLKSKREISSRNLIWFGIAILFISLSALAGFSKITETYMFISSSETGTSALSSLDIKDEWEFATIQNFMRLTRGESNNEQFGLIEQSRLTYFIPILVFSWLFFVSKKVVYDLFGKRMQKYFQQDYFSRFS